MYTNVDSKAALHVLIAYLPSTLCHTDDCMALVLYHLLQVLEQPLGSLKLKGHLRDEHGINHACTAIAQPDQQICMQW